MATSKELKDWQSRHNRLKAVLSIARNSVEQAEIALAKARTWASSAETKLAEHWQQLPKLTGKQIMGMLTGEEIRWLRDLVSGPDLIPNNIHEALAALGYVTRQGQHTVITDSGRAAARALSLK